MSLLKEAIPGNFVPTAELSGDFDSRIEIDSRYENEGPPRLRFNNIVLQPTSLCNLNCSYCYLSFRNKNQKMSPEIAKMIASTVAEENPDGVTSVIWHGGEPLATGLLHFKALVEPFADMRRRGLVRHYVQTNATLINEQWCKFFIEGDFDVGVSIDGPAWANVNRVDWNGSGSFQKIINGVNLLKKHRIPFSAIAVVHEDSLGRAEELYEFFGELGCKTLGINIEEREGVNNKRKIINGDRVTEFWHELYENWRKDKKLRIRDFYNVFSYINAVLDDNSDRYCEEALLSFPTVAWNGDVYLLSPEFAGISSERYGNFVAGNLREKPLSEIIKDSEQLLYVLEYREGVEKCRKECPYFDFCGGGQASNKYFENGRIDTTETAFCRNSKRKEVK